MPNHIHLLVSIHTDGRDDIYTDGRDDPAPTISNVIGYYKFQTTKEINIPGFWQRSFHDHIIRDEADYQRVWHYIDCNPERWAEDDYYV